MRTQQYSETEVHIGGRNPIAHHSMWQPYALDSDDYVRWIVKVLAECSSTIFVHLVYESPESYKSWRTEGIVWRPRLTSEWKSLSPLTSSNA